MGGAAVEALVRAGVGRVGLADFDRFEATNLNRQRFASTRTLGRAKTEATAEGLREINPELAVRCWGPEWTERLDEILSSHDLVVNGMDDPRAAIRLYRSAERCQVPVVDAYLSPHPSVFVVRPTDPRPEARLGFPTVGVADDALTDELLRAAQLCELAWVAAVSRGIEALGAELVGAILRGERPRPSFAPVVTISGNLMAYEAIAALLDRPTGVGVDGYFLDLTRGRIEVAPTTPEIEARRRRAQRTLLALAEARAQ
jgi:molybdopterin/thiamine biosynthesis adenylyltransferase